MPGQRLQSGLKLLQLYMEIDVSAFVQKSNPIAPGGLQFGSLLDLWAVMDTTPTFWAFKEKSNSSMRVVETPCMIYIYIYMTLYRF